MVSNHAHSSLDLSALNSDVEYSLPVDNTAQRCQIHVKLTESCSRAIDSLISSNKGAVFSLWFTENGGHLTLPSANGNHTFQFSTAVLNSTLECFHQHTTQDRQQKLAMIGRLEHKLTVKATDDVYEETKKKAKQLEEERQGVRAKEIKIPKIKPKVSSNRPIHKPSFDTSVISRNAGTSKGGVGGSGGGASSKPSQLASSNRAQQKSLKERVIHILAIRPCRRIDVLSKLKKATKKGDNFFSSLDNVLSEVAKLQDSTYHLKDAFISELDVDNWPFYSEAERDFVKRKLSKMTSSIGANDNHTNYSMPSIKRSADESTVTDHTPPLKRPKPESDPVSTQTPPISNKITKPPDSLTNEKRPHLPRLPIETVKLEQSTDRSGNTSKFVSSRYIGNHDNASTNQRTETNNEFGSSNTKRETQLQQQQQLHFKVEVGGAKEEVVPQDEDDKSKRHKKKKKKKHKQQVEDTLIKNDPLPSDSMLTNDNAISTPAADTEHSSTPDTVGNNGGVAHRTDFEKLYPKIISYAKRTEYKQIFNTEYKEYLLLTQKMEAMHREVTELTKHFNSLPRNSTEVREVKHRIKKKYYEMQKDPIHQEEKQRLSELHDKLDHIKKMVMLFDEQCAAAPSTPSTP